MDYISWGILAGVILILIGYFIYKLVTIIKMPKEDKRELLLTYLKGAVALFEKEIVGDKKGQERLEKVEEYFKEHAGVFLKLVLKYFGEDSLRNLIETALKEIKESFEK